MGDSKDFFLPLFEAERGRLVNRLRHIVSSQAVAEDLVQETFLRLWDRAPDEQSQALLYRTARNLAFDYLRAQKVRHRYAASQAQLPEPVHPPPERDLESSESWRELRRVLERLPVRTREIFLLNRVHGETYAAIAGRLGVSTSAVEKHMMRAMKACRHWQKSRDGR